MRTVVDGERPPVIEAWLEDRRRKGLDLFDEVWEGELWHPHRIRGTARSATRSAPPSNRWPVAPA